MKNRFLITLSLLIVMATMLCCGQELTRPSSPSAEGQQAIRDMLGGSRQTGNANTKSVTFKDAAFLEFVAKSLKNDSLSPAGNDKDLLKGDGSRAFVRQERTEVVVRNDECKRFVRIKTNRPDGKYEEGELMELEVVSDVEDGYHYIVNQRPDGTFYVIYPKEHDVQKPVKAGETVMFPGKGYEIETQAPFGEEKIIAIVSKQKLNLKQLESPAFYAQRGLLKGDGAKNFERVERVEIAADDFPCQTITVTSYPKDQRPSSQPKQRFVLIVGVPIYQSERYRPLPACNNDVILMKKIFCEYGQIDGFIELVGTDATKEKVREAFNILAEKSRHGDEIFVVWTGHGSTMADTTGRQPTGQTGYLVLHDSKPNDLPASVLTDDEFEHWLDHLDGRRIAIFLDACNSGIIIDANAKSGEADNFNFFANKFARLTASKDIRPDQAAVLCSSTGGQASLVINTEIPFSAMLMCMAHCIISNEKAVNFDDICKYAKENVPLLVKESYGLEQTPVSMNEIGTIYIKP